MKKQINVKDLPCPQPVMMTKKELDAPEVTMVEVQSNSEISKENILRLANSLGHTASVAQQGTDYIITITKNTPPAIPQSTTPALAPASSQAPANLPTTPIACQRPCSFVVYIASDCVGQGDPELGKILMRSFFKTVLDTTPLPAKILFINRGIFLTTKDSPVLNTIQELSKKGVTILSCGTCLDFYKRKELLEVGVVTNMFEIVESLKNADKIIQP